MADELIAWKWGEELRFKTEWDSTRRGQHRDEENTLDIKTRRG